MIIKILVTTATIAVGLYSIQVNPGGSLDVIQGGITGACLYMMWR